MSTPSSPSRFRGLSFRGSGFFDSYLIPVLVLLGSLGLTWWVWQQAVTDDQAVGRLEFQRQVEIIRHRIADRVTDCEYMVLGGAGFFSVHGNVTRADWYDYVRGLRPEDKLSGVQGLGFSQRIAATDLTAHTAQIRAEGFPAYAVRPDTAREEYHTIIYLEPFEGRNLRAFGYDMFSEPVRRKAMERARDEGTIAMSGPVTLVQEIPGQAVQQGFLIFAPVYTRGARIATVAERRAALRGFVYSPFRAGDFFDRLMFLDPLHLILEVHGKSAHPTATLLYSSAQSPRGAGLPAGFRPHYKEAVDMKILGETWSIVLQSTPAFEQREQPHSSSNLLMFGILSSLLTSGFVFAQSSRSRVLGRLAQTTQELTKAHDELEQRVYERTVELAHANARLEVDLRARLAAEADLARVSLRFQALLAVASDGIHLIDETGRLHECSESFRHMLGYSAAEAAQLSVADWDAQIRPEDLPGRIQTFIREGAIFETVHRRKDGTLFPVEINARGIQLDGRSFLYASSRDITVRRQAEAEIHRLAEFQHGTLDSLSTRLAVADAQGHILTTNRAWQESIGARTSRPPFASATTGFATVVTTSTGKQDDAARQLVRGIEQVARGEGTEYRQELVFRTSGDPQWFAARVTRFLEAGEVRVVIAYDNITSRKLIEAALRDREERLRLAILGANLATWDWHIPSGRTTFNPRWSEMLGYDASEVTPRVDAWETLLHPEDRPYVMSVLQSHLSGQTPAYESEHRLRHKNGHWIWVLDRGAVIERDAANQPVRACGTHLDITDRKRTEAVLRDLQRQLLWAMDQAFLAYWELRLDTRVFTFNDRFYALLGTTAEREGGYQMEAATYAREFLPPEDYPLVFEVPVRAFEAGATEHRVEHRIRRRDGTLRRIVSRIVLFRGNEGGPDYCRGVIQDISDLRAAEQFLRESEEKFHSFMDALPGVAFIKDASGHHHYVNPTLRRLLGQPGDSTAALSPQDYLSSDEAAVVAASDARVLARQESEFLELTLTFRGARHIFLTHKFPIMRQGRDPLIGGIAIDITERRRSEEELRQSEVRFRSVVAAMAEGLVLQSADGTIIDCNQQAEVILGLTRDQILGRTSYDPAWAALQEDGSPFPGEEHPAMVTLRTGRRASNVVMGVQLPGGERRWININAEPLFRPDSAQPSAVVATFTDITGRLREQRRLRELLAQTERDSHTKTALLQEVNHRVANNLSSVLGLLAYEKEHGLGAQHVSAAPAMDRLSQRIRGLLIVHRMLAQSEWAPVRLEPLADQIIRAVIGGSGRPAVEVVILPSSVTISPRQASTVALILNELATNSVKHASDPARPLRITCAASRRDDWIHVHYQDNGPGYPPEVLIGERRSVGLQLILEVLAKSLRGPVVLSNEDGAVALVQIRAEEENRT